MTKFLLPIGFICFLICSCEYSGENNENVKSEDFASDSITEPAFTYLSNNEVEKLINSNQNQFLSAFWPGMTETQCLEVLRYLVDKEKCVAQFSNDQDIYEDIPSKEIKSIKLISKETGFASTTDYKFLYRLRAENKLLVFEMEFNFSSTDSLLGITLLDADLGNMENLNLNDFEYFVDLYSSKYGKPVDKTFKDISPIETIFKTKDYRRYRYLKNGISIELEYMSAYIEDNELESKTNQIHIIYQEYDVTNHYTTYEENRQADIKWKEDQKKKRAKEEKERLKKEKKESLESI